MDKAKKKRKRSRFHDEPQFSDEDDEGMQGGHAFILVAMNDDGHDLSKGKLVCDASGSLATCTTH